VHLAHPQSQHTRAEVSPMRQELKILCLLIFVGTYVSAVGIQRRDVEKIKRLRADKAHVMMTERTRAGMEDCCNIVIPEVEKALTGGGVTFSEANTLEARFIYLDSEGQHAAMYAIDTDPDFWPKDSVELSYLASDATVKSAGPFMFFRAMCAGWKAAPDRTNFVLNAAPLGAEFVKKHLPRFTAEGEIPQNVLEGYYTSLGMAPAKREHSFSAPYSSLYPKCVANQRISTSSGPKPLFEEITTTTEGEGANIKLLTAKVNGNSVFPPPAERKCCTIL